jgi:hypothetical protein
MNNLSKLLAILSDFSLVKIFIISGIILMGSAFVTYDQKLIISNEYSCIRLLIGVAFLLIGLLVQILSVVEQITSPKITVHGKKYRFNKTDLLVKIGNIENRENFTSNSIVLLPANTKFDDDCITDINSALGSFFLTHYPNRIEEAKSVIIQMAQENCFRIGDNEYELGSTLILSEPFTHLTNIAITAITTRIPRQGILTNISAISLSIKNIFELTADKKIDKIVLPLLGSGHGGLETKIALNSILFNVKYYSSIYHHIKNVLIVLYNKDNNPEKIKIVNWRYL